MVSLIIWSLLLIVSLKYAVLILRADNRGEGGILALLALLGARRARPGTWRGRILVLGLVGAALLYGDGAITPAISVLSAVEGLKVDAPGLAPVVLPITLAILIGLFLVQRRGTIFIAGICGPIMLAWFVVTRAARCRVGKGRAAMEPGKTGVGRPAIISNAGIMSSRPATIETPGAIATSASRSMMMPKERFCRLPMSQPKVKWSFGASSCSRCNTTEVGITALALGGGVGFSSSLLNSCWR